MRVTPWANVRVATESMLGLIVEQAGIDLYGSWPIRVLVHARAVVAGINILDAKGVTQGGAKGFSIRPDTGELRKCMIADMHGNNTHALAWFIVVMLQLYCDNQARGAPLCPQCRKCQHTGVRIQRDRVDGRVRRFHAPHCSFNLALRRLCAI